MKEKCWSKTLLGVFNYDESKLSKWGHRVREEIGRLEAKQRGV